MKHYFHFDHIFVINLKHRDDRLEHVKREFQKLNVPTRVVTQEQFNQTPLFQGATIVRFEKHPVNGTQGCATSHQSIYRYAIKHKLDAVLIFEDDVSFELPEDQLFQKHDFTFPELQSQYTHIYEKLVDGSCDIAFMGYGSHVPFLFRKLACPNFDYIEHIWCLHAYAISLKAMKQMDLLIDRVYQLYPEPNALWHIDYMISFSPFQKIRAIQKLAWYIVTKSDNPWWKPGEKEPHETHNETQYGIQNLTQSSRVIAVISGFISSSKMILLQNQMKKIYKELFL